MRTRHTFGRTRAWRGACVAAAVVLAVTACSSSAPSAAPGDDDAPAAATPDSDPETDTDSEVGDETEDGTDTDVVAAPVLDDVTLVLEEVADGLDRPIQVVDLPGGTGGPLVAEQVGRLREVAADGRVLLDITDRVLARGEQGLLGLSWSPGFPDDPRVFVHYSRAGDGATVLAEFRSAADGVVDPASETVLLTVPQPAGNHNGGSVVFGPDGMLYLALGDGGAAGDRFGNGQRPDTLLGALLRLDVAEPGVVRAADGNPFADGGGAPEVWAYGLRNPYRITFHDGALVVADVGQDAVEEVTVVPADAAGLNFGWPVWEGDACFSGPCDDPSPYVFPQVTDDHGDGTCSVIGGAVYGGEVAVLRDHYFHGDLCAGTLTSVHLDGTAVGEVRDWTEDVGGVEGVTSLDTWRGEVMLTTADGRVLRLVASTS